jgi:hypothetical protein
MKYQEFIQKTKELGYEGILPPYFDNIIDDVYYSPSQIAEIVNVSNETARRWFRKGKLMNHSVRNYKTLGTELKNYLYLQILDQLKRKYPEIFLT